jgi:glycosyltransferase involved in cell wall biosynthesis
VTDHLVTTLAGATADTAPTTLMIVSAPAGADVRRAAAMGERPCPEFLRLEQAGVTLLDWTALGLAGGHRSRHRSLRHVASAWHRIAGVDAVFSDGEHVGIPLAAAMQATGRRVPHLMLGHHLASRRKIRAFRWAHADAAVDRILVHSANQVDVLASELRIPASRLAVVPYAVDVDYWQPIATPEQGNLVVATGREHRDYAALVAACPASIHLFITDASAHSPHAVRTAPEVWPPNVERRSLPLRELRDLYARASVVVVPVLPTASPFGVTSLLEAMAMGKAVVVTATAGLRGLVDDGVTGLLVPPGDAAAMNCAIEHLLADPGQRHEMGRAARAAAVERFGLDRYVAELVRHLREIAPNAGETP